MTERDRILASLSPTELLIWHAQGGVAEDLPGHQRLLLIALIYESNRELGPPPRRMSPSEWQQYQRAQRQELIEDRQALASA